MNPLPPHHRLLFAILVSTSLASLPKSTAQEPPPPLYHSAVFFSQDAAVEVTINGFPLYQLPKQGNQATESGQIERFLKRGDNTIALTIKPLVMTDGTPNPKHVVSADLSAYETSISAAASVLKIERVSDLTAEEPNLKTEIQTSGQIENVVRTRGSVPAAELIFDSGTKEVCCKPVVGDAQVLRLSLNLPRSPLPDLPWLGGAAVPLPAEVQALKEAVAAIRTALAAGDLDAVDAALDFKFGRLAASMGVAKATIATETRATFQLLINSDGFSFAPLTAADLVVEPFPGLNLVRVNRPAGMAITGSGTELKYETSFYFSKIEGVWVLVE